MPLYSYRALNEVGRTIKGTMNAANEVDLEYRLGGVGLDLLTSKEIKKGKLSLSGGGKITLQDLIIMCVYMEQLNKAGVPLLESVADLRETADNVKMKDIMADIYESLKNGSMLSAAMASHPKVFDEIFTGLIAAGEKTGNLHEIFHHLADHLRWVNDIKKKIKKASTYPIVLLIMMSGVITLMMMFVIPQLANFLQAQDFELPWYTDYLIKTSNAFGNYWYLILGTPVFIVTTIVILNKTVEPFAYFTDQIKLNLPVIGPLVRKTEMARFCRFFSITYQSGIGILDCMDVASGVVQNRLIKEAITMARRQVSEGNNLTASLQGTNQFSNLVLRMFKVGEDSGNLDNSLDNVNFFYDQEISEGVDRMIGMIQPALTIIMGTLMLWVSMAVFGPLYQSFSKMNF